jgi:hypothetical protein
MFHACVQYRQQNLQLRIMLVTVNIKAFSYTLHKYGYDLFLHTASYYNHNSFPYEIF